MNTHTPKIPILIATMLFTGTINTLLNKFQDLTCIRNCDDEKIHFEQPLIQTMNMFVGEVICLGVYVFMKRRNEYVAIPGEVEDATADTAEDGDTTAEITLQQGLWFLLPTLCDLLATTLMNVGLIYISASIYQMLRGSVVLFTGIFSRIFLKIVHPAYRWVGLFIVVCGVSVVGLASILQAERVTLNTGNPVLGTLLVVLAQMFSASQFVIEEKIMSSYNVPALKAVGLEGLFGLLICTFVVPILHFTLGVQNPGSMFDINETIRQLLLPRIYWSAMGICISISLFNYSGLQVTKYISATSRSTIDTCRTLFIWIASLVFGWEVFKSLQILGFLLLVYGTFVFNDIVKLPFFKVEEEELHED